MRHLADQPADGVARQPRIGVERDDVAHVGGASSGVPSTSMKLVSVAPRSSRFSSCSLPRLRSQPIQRASPGVPDPPGDAAAGTARRQAPGHSARLSRAMPFAAAASSASSPSVCLGRGVQSSRKAERNAGRLPGWRDGGSPDCSICSSIDAGRGQQRRHGDEGAQMRGNAVGKLQSRAAGWRAETEASRPIDQRDRRVDGGDDAQHRRACRAATGRRPWRRAASSGSGEQDQGDERRWRRHRPPMPEARCSRARHLRAAADGSRWSFSNSLSAAARSDDSRDRFSRVRSVGAAVPPTRPPRRRRCARRRVPCGRRRAPIPRWRCDRDCASGNPCP